MALPQKSQVEQLTDSLAAAIATEVAAQDAAALAPATGSFRTLTDAFGDPDLEDLLNPVAAALDASLLDSAGNLTTRLAPKYGSLLNALRAAVAADGTYDTVDAYLTGIGAHVAPEIQSIAPTASGLGAALSPVNVFSPSIATRAPDMVLAGADGALVNVTASADDATTGDTNIFAAQNDALYLAFNRKPAGVADTGIAYEYLTFALGTAASVDVAFTSKYWDGTAWSNLTLQYFNGTGWANLTQSVSEGGTSFSLKGFTQKGIVRFAIPGNWARGSVNPSAGNILDSDLTPRYFVRFERTAATVVTPPVLNHVRAGIGMGLAIIKAANTVFFQSGATVNGALYDAVDRLKLRALTAISANVTATIGYTNRAATTGRSQAQSAWSAIAGLGLFPADDTFLALQAANEGVSAVTALSAVTTATTGIFCVESVPARVPAR